MQDHGCKMKILAESGFLTFSYPQWFCVDYRTVLTAGVFCVFMSCVGQWRPVAGAHVHHAMFELFPHVVHHLVSPVFGHVLTTSIYSVYVLQMYHIKCNWMHGAQSGCVEMEMQCMVPPRIRIYIFRGVHVFGHECLCSITCVYMGSARRKTWILSCMIQAGTKPSKRMTKQSNKMGKNRSKLQTLLWVNILK